MKQWYVLYVYILIESDDGLLPDGTKPLPDQVLAYHQRSLHLRAFT